MPDKHNARNPGADRRHRRTGIVAAIEQRIEFGCRYCFPRRSYDRAEPARAGIDPGIGRAGDDHRPPRLRRRTQRSDGMRQRMDDDDGRGFRSAGVRPARRMRARGPRSGQAIAPKWAATSTMRLEKPHSLSYHDRTRTKRLSSTWVWVTSKVELCGSWLKSHDTVGALLMPMMPRQRFDLAASCISALTSSPEVSRAESNLKSISDTLAVGTRIAVPSSLPFSAGNTSPTARAAPVEVGISETAAARARRRSLCSVSCRLWSPV